MRYFYDPHTNKMVVLTVENCLSYQALRSYVESEQERRVRRIEGSRAYKERAYAFLYDWYNSILKRIQFIKPMDFKGYIKGLRPKMTIYDDMEQLADALKS